MSNQEILEVKNLKVNFDVRSEGDMPWTKAKKLKAVNDVSFSLRAGETLGVVGESGSVSYTHLTLPTILLV